MDDGVYSISLSGTRQSPINIETDRVRRTLSIKEMMLNIFRMISRLLRSWTS